MSSRHLSVRREDYNSDNMMGADNQQERLPFHSGFDASRVPTELGFYLAGFVDGEGSFNVSFRKATDRNANWRVGVCFNVSQRDPHVLNLLQSTLKCGRLRDRGDGVYYFEVNSISDLQKKVIPFFQHFEIRSPGKRYAFLAFIQICEVISGRMHLTREGMQTILEIREDMNACKKRRYSTDEILHSLRMEEESSEAIRQAPGTRVSG